MCDLILYHAKMMRDKMHMHHALKQQNAKKLTWSWHFCFHFYLYSTHVGLSWWKLETDLYMKLPLGFEIKLEDSIYNILNLLLGQMQTGWVWKLYLVNDTWYSVDQLSLIEFKQ